MDNSNNNPESGEYKFPLVSPSELAEINTPILGTIQIKPKRQSISYKTEYLKSSERADKLSRWALIGWALAIIELVWLVILVYAP